MSAIVQAILGNLLLPLLKLIGDFLNGILLGAVYLVIKFLDLTALHPDGPSSMAWHLMTSGYDILAGIAGIIMLVSVVWGVIQIQQHTVFGVGAEDTPGKLVGRTFWAGLMLAGGVLYIRALLWMNNDAVRLFNIPFKTMASSFGLEHPLTLSMSALGSAIGGTVSTTALAAVFYLFGPLVGLAALAMAIWAVVMWFTRQFELLFWGAVMPVGLALSVADPQRRIWEFIKTQLVGVIFQQAIMAFVLYLTFMLAAGVQGDTTYGVFRDLMAVVVLGVGFYYSTKGPKYWQQVQGHVASGGSEIAAIAGGSLMARGAMAALSTSRGGQMMARARESMEAQTAAGLQEGSGLSGPLSNAYNRMGVNRDQAKARMAQNQAGIDTAAGTAALTLQAEAAQAASRHMARQADPISANAIAADHEDQGKPYDPSWGFSPPPESSPPSGPSVPGGPSGPGAPPHTSPPAPGSPEPSATPSPVAAPDAGGASGVPHAAPTTAGGFAHQANGLWVPIAARPAAQASPTPTPNASSPASADGSTASAGMGGFSTPSGATGGAGASTGSGGSAHAGHSGTAGNAPGANAGNAAASAAVAAAAVAVGAAATAGGHARNAQAGASQAETHANTAQAAATQTAGTANGSAPATANPSSESAPIPTRGRTAPTQAVPPVPPATIEQALPAAARLVQGEAGAVGTRNLRQSSDAVGRTAAEAALIQPAQQAANPAQVKAFGDTLAQNLGYSDVDDLAQRDDGGEILRQAVTGPDGERPFHVLAGTDPGVPTSSAPAAPTQATGGVSPTLRRQLTQMRTRSLPAPSRSAVPTFASPIPHQASSGIGEVPHTPPPPATPHTTPPTGIPLDPTAPPAWDPATFPGSGLTPMPHAEPPAPEVPESPKD